jgi:hypothetical protein
VNVYWVGLGYRRVFVCAECLERGLGGGRRECKSKISGVTTSIYRYCGITNSLATKHQSSNHHVSKLLALAH